MRGRLASHGALAGRISSSAELRGVLQIGTTVELGSKVGFKLPILSSDWQVSSSRYKLMIPQSVHPLGMGAYVSDVERSDSDRVGSVLYAYSRLANGTLIVYSDVVFNGAIILEEVIG